MMGFTADGQADLPMVTARDRRFAIQSARKKADRQDLIAPLIDPGADGWSDGQPMQIADPTGSQHRHEVNTSKTQTTNERANAQTHAPPQVPPQVQSHLTR